MNLHLAWNNTNTPFDSARLGRHKFHLYFSKHSFVWHARNPKSPYNSLLLNHSTTNLGGRQLWMAYFWSKELGETERQAASQFSFFVPSFWCCWLTELLNEYNIPGSWWHLCKDGGVLVSVWLRTSSNWHLTFNRLPFYHFFFFFYSTRFINQYNVFPCARCEG